MEIPDFSEKIIESMIDSVIVVDQDAYISNVNQSTLNLLGYKKSEIIGKLISKIIPEENLDFFSVVRDIIKNEYIYNYNLTYLTKLGESIPINFCGSIVRSSDGKLNSIVGVGRDMRGYQSLVRELEKSKIDLKEKVDQRTTALASEKSKTEKAYEQLKKTQSQLVQSEKLSSIGQLAAGVAHEINNPIGFINSNLVTLEDYIKDIIEFISEIEKELQTNLENGLSNISLLNDRYKEIKNKLDIEYISTDIKKLILESMDGTERVKKIVQDLKDFSRVDESDLEFANINSELDKTLNIIHNELKYKAKIFKDYGDIPDIQCFPRHLDQAFMNILINAGQAIEKQGEIRIETYKNKKDIVIKISDTGSGIAKANIEKLFDPFFTTKPVGKGTGLGLNITYNTIKKHGGDISVSSEPGKGTLFTIHIPIERDPVLDGK